MIDGAAQFSYGCRAIDGQILFGRRLLTNGRVCQREPLGGAAVTERGSYQAAAPNVSADVIYGFLSALLREAKRRSGPPTTSPAPPLVTLSNPLPPTLL